MAFDHAKFIKDRIDGKPMGNDDIAEHDTYAALYSLSMTPSLYKSIMALNTIEFSRLPTSIRAKVMNAFNGKKLNTGYLRAYPSEIASVDKLRNQVMEVYDTSVSSANFMILHNEIDPVAVAEAYEYKVNGKMPGGKTNARRKK